MLHDMNGIWYLLYKIEYMKGKKWLKKINNIVLRCCLKPLFVIFQEYKQPAVRVNSHFMNFVAYYEIIWLNG